MRLYSDDTTFGTGMGGLCSYFFFTRCGLCRFSCSGRLLLLSSDRLSGTSLRLYLLSSLSRLGSFLLCVCLASEARLNRRIEQESKHSNPRYYPPYPQHALHLASLFFLIFFF